MADTQSTVESVESCSSSFDEWRSLEQRPYSKYVNILVLNDKELLLVPYSRDSPSLFKYNRITDKWVQWFNYTVKFGTSFETRYHTVALNANSSQLYIYNEQGRVIEINLITEQSKMSKEQFHDGSHVASLVIDDEYHIFGGWFTAAKAHFIWNKDAQIMDIVDSLSEITEPNLRYHSLAYFKSTRSVLISNVAHTNKLYLYSLNETKCVQLPIALPQYLTSTKCVATSDERYLIIFGGQRVQYADNIHVVDLFNNTCNRSKVCCPQTNKGTKFEATIWNHTVLASALIAGYIRMQSDANIPSDLYKYIAMLYNYEIVHLFAIPDTDNDPLSHWSMNVDYIIGQTPSITQD